MRHRLAIAILPLFIACGDGTGPDHLAEPELLGSWSTDAPVVISPAPGEQRRGLIHNARDWEAEWARLGINYALPPEIDFSRNTVVYIIATGCDKRVLDAASLVDRVLVVTLHTEGCLAGVQTLSGTMTVAVVAKMPRSVQFIEH